MGHIIFYKSSATTCLLGKVSQARIYCSEQDHARSRESKTSDCQGLGCGLGCSGGGWTELPRPQPEAPPEPSSSRSPSCCFCPIFWYGIQLSSLVRKSSFSLQNSAHSALTTKSLPLCITLSETFSINVFQSWSFLIVMGPASQSS